MSENKIPFIASTKKMTEEYAKIRAKYAAQIAEAEALVKKLESMPPEELAKIRQDELYKARKSANMLTIRMNDEMAQYAEADRKARFDMLEKTPEAVKRNAVESIRYELDYIKERSAEEVAGGYYNDFYISSFIIGQNDAGIQAATRTPGESYYLNVRALEEHLCNLSALSLHVDFLSKYPDELENYKRDILRIIREEPQAVNVPPEFMSVYEACSNLALSGMYAEQINEFIKALTPQYIKDNAPEYYSEELAEIIKRKNDDESDTLQFEDNLDLLEEIKRSGLIPLQVLAVMYVNLTAGVTDPVQHHKYYDIAAASRFPANWATPRDIISNNHIFTGTNFLLPSEQPIREISTSRKQSKMPAYTKLAIDFNAPSIEIGTKMPLNNYAREIHDACGSLVMAGNYDIRPRMIYRAMAGNKDASASPEVLEEISKYIRTMIHIPLTIDASEELKQYGVAEFTYEGNLLPAHVIKKRMTGETEAKDTIHFSDIPGLFQYAALKDQVAKVPMQVINIGRNMDSDDYSIRGILLRSIVDMKPGQSTTVLISDILKEISINTTTPAAYRNKKAKIIKSIKGMLDHFKKEKLIASYSVLDRSGRSRPQECRHIV